jgi:hypothetical protein
MDMKLGHSKGVWEKGTEVTFGPAREEVEGGWRRLHDEELHILYALPNIIQVIKSRRMRWAGHLTRIAGIDRCVFWMENPKGRNHSKDLGQDGRQC